MLFGNGSHDNLGCQAIDLGTACGLAEQGVEHLTFMPARLPFSAELVAEVSGVSVSVDTSLRDALASTGTRVARRLAQRLHPTRRPGVISPFLHLGAERRASMALALGGDNYTFDYGPPDVFFAANRVFLDAEVPLMMWGASIGPFSADIDYERMAAAELSKTDCVFVREDVTAGYLDALGLGSKVFRMSDPAFLMPSTLEGVDIDGLSGAVGLNFSPLIGAKLGLDHVQWRGRCAEMITRLCADFSEPFVLVPHVTVGESDDRALLVGAWESLQPSVRSRVTVLPPGMNALQVKGVVGQLSAFVGARTHATIAAMSQGVPTISLGYSAKAVGVNQDVFGHDRFVIGFDALSTDVLAQRLSELLGESAAIRRSLVEVLPSVQDRSRAGFARLKARMDGSSADECGSR